MIAVIENKFYFVLLKPRKLSPKYFLILFNRFKRDDSKEAKK